MLIPGVGRETMVEVENMINELNLKNTKYYNIASYGHFGRTDINLPWENVKNTLQQKEKNIKTID